MYIMLDAIIDGLIDTLKLLPYLFVTFVILEYLEHKMNKKHEKALAKKTKLAPIVGSTLGALPQCGFSTMAASLFSKKVITMGTVIAVFLSTSDEMLPIMIGEHTSVGILLKIVGFKVLLGIVVGLIVDLVYRPKKEHVKEEVEHLCHKEHCHCEKDGIFKASIKHTLKIGLFILIANLLINLVICFIGEENLGNILLKKNILTYFLASLIGLIPNCASSVIMTELYLSGLVTIGTLMAGLLTGSGLGILLLFKENKNIKENITILSIIYLVGITVGCIVDIIL